MTDDKPMPRVLYVNEPQERPDGSLMYDGDASRFHARHKYILAETMPADWHEDSSLETWFPITAEELNRLRAAAQRPALPEYEAHIDHIAGEVRYSLSFASNADRAAFLKAALQSPAVPMDNINGAICLIKAAEYTFKYYAENHRAKNPPDEQKALRNDMEAAAMRKALALLGGKEG